MTMTNTKLFPTLPNHRHLLLRAIVIFPSYRNGHVNPLILTLLSLAVILSMLIIGLLKIIFFCGCGLQAVILNNRHFTFHQKFGLRTGLKMWCCPRPLKILDAIDRLSSIQGAAKELRMSYRAIWERINANEERLNRPLLIRNKRGRSGGRSQLTPFTLSLLVYFRHLHQRISDLSDAEFEKTMAPHF